MLYGCVAPLLDNYFSPLMTHSGVGSFPNFNENENKNESIMLQDIVPLSSIISPDFAFIQIYPRP